ncbi:MAG: DUF4167 domain-containing protein [Alphaproteobacteria bacterium]|nr:DUF4167 domain-containing protein [Alphaproteobacteria bacterium]
MRQGTNPKGRSRGRGGSSNNSKPAPIRGSSFDNGAPPPRVRGNAGQMMDKFLSLARDASSQGDRVLAENYFQHADHYFRVMNNNPQPGGRGPRPPGGQTPAQPGSDAERAEDLQAESEGNDGTGNNEESDDGNGNQPENPPV